MHKILAIAALSLASESTQFELPQRVESGHSLKPPQASAPRTFGGIPGN
jgi:hypothetical protein